MVIVQLPQSITQRFMRICEINDSRDQRGHSGLHDAVGARCSSVVRAFAHGAMGRRIDPSWGGPIELFLVPASDP